jgi:hypothetical protein
MNAEEYNEKYLPVFAPTGFPLSIRRRVPPSAGAMRIDLIDPTPMEVMRIQRDLRLKQDGFCGPDTIQAIAAEERFVHTNGGGGTSGIFVGPNFIPTHAKTATFDEDFTLGDTASRTRRVRPTQIVLHYDVAFNARAAESILQKRGYSTHFIIDHDGTIVQCHNPATKVAFHAGRVNDYTIGIDINNPADVKYRARDASKRGGPERDIVEERIHGGLVRRLDYFPEQITSLSELLDILCNEFDIPRTCPRDCEGPLLKKLDNADVRKYGVLGHYHLSLRKTDPSPLNWDEIGT